MENEMRIYMVETSYDIKHYPDKDQELESMLGMSDESGIGFGQRDIGWCFKTQQEAENAKKEIEKFGLEAWTHDYDDEEDDDD
jgi:hypothetical protein